MLFLEKSSTKLGKQKLANSPVPSLLTRFSIPQVCSLALVLSTWVVLKQEFTLRFLKPFPVQP